MEPDIVYVIPLILLFLFNYFISRSDEYDKAPLYVFGNLFIGLPLVLITILVLNFTIVKTVNVNCAEVTEIGGCNRHNCGVKLSNGNKTVLSTPVIGEVVCEKELEWR